MKVLILTLWSLLACASWALSQPTNNPVLDTFPESDSFYVKGVKFGDYSWTSSIQWATVYDVTTDLTAPPFSGLSNVTKDNLPPNHPNADLDDITGHGSDDSATVNAAISQLSAAGGGVLYFPAGVYVFSENIVMKDGVVLRGADPAGITDARTTGYDPATDFFFPRLPGIVDDADVPVFGKRMSPAGVAASTAIGGTYTNPGDPTPKMLITRKVEIDQTFPAGLTSSNYGIVNVDLHRAAIQFLQEFQSDGTIERNNVLFGSFYRNRMEGGNVVVFGNRINNAVDLEWQIANDADHNSWQLWPNRVAGHIDVMVKENSIIANNRINDMHYDFLENGASLSNSPPVLLVDSFGMATGGDVNAGGETDYTNTANVYIDRNGGQIIGSGGLGGEDGVGANNNKYVLFRYTQGIGILQNRAGGPGYGDQSNAAGEPSLNRPGNACRQNWAYVTNRVGFQVSGFGVEVRDNVRLDSSGRTNWLRPDGRNFQTNIQATYENRGIDVSGDNIFINNNTYDVQRAVIGFGPNLTGDGEGILIQPTTGQNPITNWTITNNSGNKLIELRNIGSMRDCNISNNTLTDGDIQIEANPLFYPGIARDMTLNNNTTSIGISIEAGLMQPNSTWVISNNSGPVITVPDYTNSLLPSPTQLNDAHYLTWGNSTALTFSDANAGIAGGAGDFPFENVIDEPPVVKVISPKQGEVLSTGNYTVQVEVTAPSTVIGNTLASVTLYDASQLAPREDPPINGSDHRSNVNALAGATALTFNGSTGYYEGTWNITQEFLDYGLFVIDAAMTTLTVQDGVNNDPAIDRSFTDVTFGRIGIEEGRVFTVGDPQIVIASGTDPTMSFDMAPGGTYMLQKRNSLTSGDWEFVSGQIVTNGSSKTVGMLTDTGALPGDPETFYRIVER